MHRVFGVNLGDDVVDLLLRLGHEFAGLVAELVGAANRRAEQRIQRLAHLREILRRPHRGDAEHEARQQRGFEHRRTDADDGNRRHGRNHFAAVGILGGLRRLNLTALDGGLIQTAISLEL